MDKKLKRKWVEALRSGEYQQGRGTLREVEGGTDRFCCLGVLCDVYDPDEWIVRESSSCDGHGILFDDMDYTIGDYTIGDDSVFGHVSNNNLPTVLRDLIGMDSGQETILMELNDDKRLSFNEIADWIEANIPDD